MSFGTNIDGEESSNPKKSQTKEKTLKRNASAKKVKKSEPAVSEVSTNIVGFKPILTEGKLKAQRADSKTAKPSVTFLMQDKDVKKPRKTNLNQSVDGRESKKKNFIELNKMRVRTQS